MTERNPTPPQLSHLDAIRRAGMAHGMREAAAAVEAMRNDELVRGVPIDRWAARVAQFIRDMADAVAPP